MDKIKWIIFAVICIGILVAVVLISQGNEAKYEGDVSKPITDGPIADHAFGSTENKVVLVEYGDFQCPACLSIYPTVKELKEKYKDTLTFVFRNLPLTNKHPNALAAATAAEAAGLQGKFFEMHDKLYDMQAEWGQSSVSDRGGVLERYAQSLGLNVEQFKKDLTTPAISEKIKRDRATARTIDATSTPTFLVNGQKLPEASSTDPNALTTAVEDALRQAGLLIEEPQAAPTPETPETPAP